jgi:hypothetical protein
MDVAALTQEQRSIIERPTRGGDTLFAYGPAGAGKSTALLARLVHLLRQPIRGESILVLTPDRAARLAVEDALARAPLGPHGRPLVNTYYGLARRMVDLFWPAIAGPAGFAHPERSPVFLTYETAQYLMHEIARPLQEAGYFGELRIRPRRLTSQLLDNLNKAAINGFSHEEIAERLTKADPQTDHARYYAQAQECANRFRQECLKRNALDVSLTIEVFRRWLIPNPLFWAFFSRQYRHLIADNVEETVPAAQDLIAQMLQTCDSATLAYDEGGGFRILLGVDPEGARLLGDRCRTRLALPDRFVANPALRRLAAAVAERLGQPAPAAPADAQLSAIAEIKQTEFRSQMILWAAERIASLVRDQGARPADIAVICPYADGVLRFGLQEALRAQGVAFHTVRRWVSFRDEATSRALLTLAALAHPDWQMPPQPHAVAEALHVTIAGLDLVRATLLQQQVYRVEGELLPADRVEPRLRERIGFAPVEAYGQLYDWLAEYRAGEPAELERFLARLFEDVLCGAAFWTAEAADKRAVCARLIDSALKFRQAAPARAEEAGEHEAPARPIGADYLRMIEQGIVAGEYVERGAGAEDAVLLVTPAYTYLLEGRLADYHFWMDIGSREWWRPPHQPLTNPIVLSRRWQPGETWTPEKDAYLRDWLLARMTDGLTKRCRKQVFLCGSDMDSLGQPQDGPLFPALLAAFEAAGVVEE